MRALVRRLFPRTCCDFRQPTTPDARAYLLRLALTKMEVWFVVPE